MKARAISAVVSPATARRVSATCASRDRAGWQQVKTSRRRSRTGARSALRLAAVDHRTHFDRSAGWPLLRHRDRFVQVGDIDFGVAADRFLALDEGAVRDHRLTVVEPDGGRGALRLQLMPAGDLARVFSEPFVDRAIGRLPLGLWHGVPLPGAVLAIGEQQYVLHLRAPP